MAAKKQVSPAVAVIVIVIVLVIIVVAYMTFGSNKAKQGDPANPQMLQGGSMQQMQQQMKSKGQSPGGGGPGPAGMQSAESTSSGSE